MVDQWKALTHSNCNGISFYLIEVCNGVVKLGTAVCRSSKMAVLEFSFQKWKGNTSIGIFFNNVTDKPATLL